MENTKVKKVLFAAGGTGGHVFPAIAVADAMRALDDTLDIAFVGAAHGNEANWVKKAGYRFILLDVDFIKGASFGRKLKNVFSLPRCAKNAMKILRDESPDLVIGAGGYVSGPIVFMAATHHIRTAIMEQNAIPGLTNRILSHFVDKIYISFQNTTKLPVKKLCYMGNPVRSEKRGGEHADLAWEESCENGVVSADPNDRLHLLIFGGSQGAMKLNTDVPKGLAKLPQALREKIAVYHQAGKGKCEETRKAYEDAQIHAKTTEFIDDMWAAYRWADLIICRAGATSLAEIKAAGKASILVPFPFAAHNHQEKNADVMVQIGASLKVLNDEVAEKIPEILEDLFAHRDKLRSMEASALADARPNAATAIAEDCLNF